MGLKREREMRGWRGSPNRQVKGRRRRCTSQNTSTSSIHRANWFIEEVEEWRGEKIKGIRKMVRPKRIREMVTLSREMKKERQIEKKRKELKGQRDATVVIQQDFNSELRRVFVGGDGVD